MRIIVCTLIALALGCTTINHRERTFTNGEMTWEWRTEASTFIGDKEINLFIDTASLSAQLHGEGIDEEFRDVALRAIEKSPELADAIIKAMVPGGPLAGALADLTTTDPELAEKITEALRDE